MSMSNPQVERLKERMSVRETQRSVGSRGSRRDTKLSESAGDLPRRMTALEKDRKSFAHLRQSMIVPPRVLEWWEKEVVEYAFSHPRVRSRMERLMGSNITRLTDRKYMQRLAERIQEDHEATLERRIRAREEAEVEREKKLILAGKIPVEQVPHELADHPVFKISRITSQAIETRRSKVQRPTMRMSYIPQDALTALARVISVGGAGGDEEVQAVHEQVAEYEADREAQEAYDAAQTTAFELSDIAVSAAEVKKDTEEILQEVVGMADSAVEESVQKKKERLKKIAEETGEVWESPEEDEDEDETEDLPSAFGSGFPFKQMLGDVETMAAQDASTERSEVGRRKAVLQAAQRRREHRRRERKVFEKQEHTETEGSEDEAPDAAGQAVTQAAQRAEWEAEQAEEEAAAVERDRDYTLEEEEFRRLKYESPLIEQLRKKETVAELYELADEIVGGLWLGKANRPSLLGNADIPLGDSDDSKDDD